MDAGLLALHQVTWRCGSKATTSNKLASMIPRFLSLRVRPATCDIPAESTDPCLPNGFSPNGQKVRPRPPITGFQLCWKRCHGKNWSGSQKFDITSSTTTAN